MANVQHSTMTGSNLHEPKGVAGASINQTYVADGAGSGAWQKIGASQIDAASVKNVNKIYVTHVITDISTAGSSWICPGVAGTINKITTVIGGAIATANCGLSFEIGGVAVTSGGITIAYSGSAAGDVGTSSPSANKTLTSSTPIEVITDGASTNTIKATIVFELDVS